MTKKNFSLAQLAELTNSHLIGNPDHIISNVADLESAKNEDISFLSNSLYEKAMYASEAGAIFVTEQTPLKEGKNYLITENPSSSFQKSIEAILGDTISGQSGFIGVHPSAVIHQSVKLGSNVTIGPHAVLDKNVCIGDNTIIDAGCSIGPHTIIGTDSYLHPNVTIRERCQIGNRVIIQPGAVIGSCGFGYLTNKQGQHIKLNQVGTVIIEDDVEIGANTTIDRSRFKSTIIGKGTKVDNLVQLGHGVILGEHNIIVSQTGIAGSTKTGRYVVIAGQVGVAGHITIADQITVAGQAGVTRSIKTPGGKYSGTPAIPLSEHQRNQVYLRNIETYVNQIKSLQKRIEILEKNSNN